MNDSYEKIRTNPLFNGIGSSDFAVLINCIEGRFHRYKRQEVVQLAGDSVETVGLVASGLVQIMREDSEGKQNLMAELGTGELFGEVFACAGITCSPVTVLAAENCEILHINYRKVVSSCSSACVFHQQLIKNMLALIARKNLLLNQKIEILSKRTTRERLLLFFEQYGKEGNLFTIPYNREELASYLCVERSAMSAELSRMQEDGLIQYERSTFELIQ